MTTAKDAEALSYFELKSLLEKKKEAEIDKVKKQLVAAEGVVEALKAQLVNLGETTAKVPARRGRKPKLFKLPAKTPRARKATRGKRGAVGDAIRAFVAGKGKAGARVRDIAAAIGKKPANVTAFFYAKNNRKAFKKVAPATFAANGK